MLKTKNLKVLSLIFFFIFCAASCAPVSQSLRREAGSRYRLTIIKGKKYLPLTFAEWDYDYDFLTQKVTLEKGDKEIIFIVGEDFFLKDGEICCLNNFSKFHRGAVFISLAFYQQELNGKSLVPERKFVQSKKQIHRIETIVIDAGHGGKDPGAIGWKGLQEKEVNLKIARSLKKILLKEGLTVILIRNSDKFVPLKKRAEIANKNKNAFFISIHANSARYRNRKPRGFEVYYLSENINDWKRARAKKDSSVAQHYFFKSKSISKNANISLWDIIYGENRVESIELARLICKGLDKETDFSNRGIKGDNFCVLRETDFPGVLVEVGFLSNPKEEAKLRSRKHQYLIAKGISRGIMNYKREYERTNGFSR